MNFIKNHSKIVIFSLGIIIIGSIGLQLALHTKAPKNTATDLAPLVNLSPIESFRTDSATVRADGKVESLGQADLRSQVSAPVAKIHVAIGERVSQGQVLVTLKNDDIVAQLEGARATLAMQEALFSQTQTGTRPENISIKESDVARVANDLDSLYASAKTILNDAYAKADDAIRARISDLYQNGYSNFPEPTFVTSDPQAKIDLVSQRIDANIHITKWQNELALLETANSRESIDTALASAETHLASVATLLTTALRAIDNAPALSATVLTGYKTNINIARTSISGATSAITGIRSQISSMRLVLTRSTQELDLLRAGSTGDQLNASRAQVDGARANVRNAESQYAKTVIRSPIDGTVATLPARVGELQSPGTIVASVVSRGALQIKAYVSSTDATTIEIGSPALINNAVKGTVTRIAPSIDPATKKIEVSIAIASASPPLVVGDTASALITTKQTLTNTGTYLLPIQAVKITPAGTYMLTVDDESRVMELPVTIGKVQGEFVEISGGIATSTKIISPVYELRSGQTVRTH
jgi:multidrug efflux pump subunit AcrA (membrane-fusion protein)